MLSNRVLVVFILVFIASIVLGTVTVLDKLTGLVGQEQAAQVSVTVATICGDNVAAQNEVCDGTDLDGATCVSLGNTGGTLACEDDCTAYDTNLCVNATANVTVAVAAAAGGPSTGGIVTSILYNADLYDTFDFATTGLQDVFIIFKSERYTVNAFKINETAAELRISYPDNRPKSVLRFKMYQTKPVDLDGDGTLDLYFTLTDMLTRRPVFHIEVIKKPVIKPGVQVPTSIGPTRIEVPAQQEIDYSNYYVESILLLFILIVAIINFGLFKRHLAKSSKKLF